MTNDTTTIAADRAELAAEALRDLAWHREHTRPNPETHPVSAASYDRGRVELEGAAAGALVRFALRVPPASDMRESAVKLAAELHTTDPTAIRAYAMALDAWALSVSPS